MLSQENLTLLRFVQFAEIKQTQHEDFTGIAGGMMRIIFVKSVG